MGVAAVTFESEGQATEHIVPGVYGYSTSTEAAKGIENGTLCVIGSSSGGKPLSLLKFDDAGEAKNTLLAGNLLEGVASAFSGSQTLKPKKVYALRINNGRQATLQLKSGEIVSLTIKAWDWGVHTNSLKLWLRQGSTSGYRVQVSYKGNNFDADNLSKKSFSVRYAGEGTGATATITTEGVKLEAKDADGNTIDVVEASFDDFELLANLVAYINDSGVYTATLIDRNSGVKSCELDSVASVPVSPDEAVIFNSDLQSIIDALKKCIYIESIEIPAGADRVVPDLLDTYVYFAGGEDGTSYMSDLEAGLKVLEKEYIDCITTAITDKAAHILISEHCTEASSTDKRKERMCIVGMSSSATEAEIDDEAKSLNSKLCLLIADPVSRTNPLTKKNEVALPSQVACMLAGMEAAAGLDTALTNKKLNILGLINKRDNKEMGRLIQMGVAPIGENEDGDFVCMRAVTTYQGSDLCKNERSMTRAIIAMNKELRRALSRGIGNNSTTSVNDIADKLKNCSDDWAKRKLIRRASGDLAVFGVSIKEEADTFRLKYSRFVAAPTNFILVEDNNVTYASEESELTI